MLNIKYGSVFDEKCDLLILPCDSKGTVTSWVHNEISHNKLPFPNKNIKYGTVRFLPTEAKYSKADFIGYAASVDAVNFRSNLDGIKSIAEEILSYATSHNCSTINIPALGTGVGRLDHFDIIEIYKDTFNTKSRTFNLYIPDKEIASQLSGIKLQQETLPDFTEKNPRVFISYSWNDISVQNWVLNLATDLCANGVDARLDRFHLKPGMDLPQWMTNEVIKADKVLLICDAHYAEKADMRKAGVGWETMIIQAAMMAQGEINTKFIAIAYGEFEKNTPIYMKSKLALSKENIDQDLKILLEQIYEIDHAPEIGAIPDWVKQKKQKASPNKSTNT